MADRPEIPERVARGGAVGMGETRGDEHGVVVLYLHHVVAELAVAESVFRIGLVVIDLRLGVMVGRIAAPLARETDDLAENEVRVGRVRIVEDRADDPGARLPHQSRAAEFVRGVGGQIELRAEGGLVVRSQQIELRFVGEAGDLHLRRLVRVEGGGRHVEAVLPVFRVFLPVPFEFHFAVDEQGGLFQRGVLFPDVALLHAVYAEVHEHVGVGTVHLRQPAEPEGMGTAGFDDLFFHVSPRRSR